LQAFDYSGTSCFNYKIADGRPKLFEINPRPGGSLRLDLNAYLDAYLAALAA
jgi:predicted ATP-grasp superfamily ATP-dependent carboligase